jgi:hypothetical protein
MAVLAVGFGKPHPRGENKGTKQKTEQQFCTFTTAASAGRTTISFFFFFGHRTTLLLYYAILLEKRRILKTMTKTAISSRGQT